MCPTEFKCAVFADGELPEAEAREVALHLDTCPSCSTLVSKLQAESRMLVQCLQDVDLAEEILPEFQPTPDPVSIGRFALGVLGAALAFRLSTGILFGVEVPAALQWLDPRSWISGIGVGFDAMLYAIQNGENAVANTIQTVAIISLAGLLLAAMARALKHGPAIGAILSVVLTMGFFSSPSYAVDIRKGAAATLPAGETVDDTLVAHAGGEGSNLNKDIVIAGTVKGDLIVGGDTVTISGNVEGNVLAAGRRIEITGTVGGNVFAVGGYVIVSGKVGGTVVGAGSDIRVTGEVARNYAVFGANVGLGSTGRVGGNVMSYGADNLIEGSINKDLYSGGAMLEFRGSARHLDFSGAQVRMTSSSRLTGDLTARVQKETNVIVDPAAKIDGSRHISLVPRRQSSYQTSGFYFWQIVRLVTAFLTGWLLFRIAPWLAPTRIASGMDWLKAGGLGLAALVTIPVAAIIVLCTVVGIPLGLMTFAVWITALYFAKIVIAEFIGRMLLKKSGAVSLLTGIAIVLLAVNLPMLGGLISFLLLLLGLGAIVMTTYRMTTTPRLAEI